jgi:hypothetical protein
MLRDIRFTFLRLSIERGVIFLETVFSEIYIVTYCFYSFYTVKKGHARNVASELIHIIFLKIQKVIFHEIPSS